MTKFFIVFFHSFIFYKVNEEQIDFVKAFNKLTDYEKAKLLETLTEEERQNLIQLRDEFEKWELLKKKFFRRH